MVWSDYINFTHNRKQQQKKNFNYYVRANKRLDNMFILVKMTSCYQKTSDAIHTLRTYGFGFYIHQLHSVTFFSVLHNNEKRSSRFIKLGKMNYDENLMQNICVVGRPIYQTPSNSKIFQLNHFNKHEHIFRAKSMLIETNRNPEK